VISRERSWLRRVRRLLLPSMVVLGLMWLAPAASPSLLDDTPPSVNYTIDGINGTNSWYRGSTGGNYVVVHWTVSDPNSPISSTSGCEPAVRVDGPNTGTTRTCTATSDGGTTAVTTKTVKIDQDAPTGVIAAADRAPNATGWYRSAVTIPGTGVIRPRASQAAGPTSRTAGQTAAASPPAGRAPIKPAILRRQSPYRLSTTPPRLPSHPLRTGCRTRKVGTEARSLSAGMAATRCPAQAAPSLPATAAPTAAAPP